MRLVDTTLADEARRFGPLSVAKSAIAIDAIVDRHDSEAVRRTRAGARGRDVVIGPDDDGSGATSLWGSLLSNDAAVLDRRLTQMAHQVCDADPRTIAQRRADALGTVAAGSEQLVCACGTPDCPASADTHPRATAVVVHVVAEASALTAHPKATSPKSPTASGPTGSGRVGPPNPNPLRHAKRSRADRTSVRPASKQPPARLHPLRRGWQPWAGQDGAEHAPEPCPAPDAPTTPASSASWISYAVFSGRATRTPASVSVSPTRSQLRLRSGSRPSSHQAGTPRLRDSCEILVFAVAKVNPHRNGNRRPS